MFETLSDKKDKQKDEGEPKQMPNSHELSTSGTWRKSGLPWMNATGSTRNSLPFPEGPHSPERVQ